MAKMQEFKCPCCGGSIEFDSSVQKMKCPFCDTEFDVGTLSEYAQTVEEEQPEDMSWSDEAGSEWQDGESVEGICIRYVQTWHWKRRKKCRRITSNSKGFVLWRSGLIGI